MTDSERHGSVRGDATPGYRLEGAQVTAVDDRFVVHMDRESLGDYDLEHYDATEVVSYYDWSQAHPEWRDSGILPVLDASALKATLGILERAVRRGYVRG